MRLFCVLRFAFARFFSGIPQLGPCPPVASGRLPFWSMGRAAAIRTVAVEYASELTEASPMKNLLCAGLLGFAALAIVSGPVHAGTFGLIVHRKCGKCCNGC